MDNLLTQWIKESTRFCGRDEPSRLDLIFTKKVNIIKNMKYGSPIGKSDHILLEFRLEEEEEEVKDES